MSVAVTGRITRILEVQSGTSANGEWRKQSFVIETEESYPKSICIMLWGDKIQDLSRFSEGDRVHVDVNIESREYNERWYTDVKAWRLQAADAGVPAGNVGGAPAATTAPASTGNVSQSHAVINDQEDDLPF